MKIILTPYQKIWLDQFLQISRELQDALEGLNPAIEHIGSTSVEGLSAKPIIDISTGVASAAEFDAVVARMRRLPTYIYYEAFNAGMPQRRLFVKLNDSVEALGFKPVFDSLEEIPHEAINEKRVAHVHVWVYGSEDWVRHIAFRDYLRTHETVRTAYETLKMELACKEWPDGMAYNAAKDRFIKQVETEAIRWYRTRKAGPDDV